jgi:hypothetical protein
MTSYPQIHVYMNTPISSQSEIGKIYTYDTKNSKHYTSMYKSLENCPEILSGISRLRRDATVILAYLKQGFVSTE